MTTFDQIVKMTKELYPDGRAYKFFEGNDMHTLYRALAHSEARAWNDLLSVLDSALPDNDNFTEDDATDWERRLGIASGGSAVPLADRKLAIIRKLNHPGTIRARQSYLYLQNQLRAAGFDVYVYENRFDDGMGGLTTKTPQEVTGIAAGFASFGNINFGVTNFGATWTAPLTLCVNHLEEERDATFAFGSNMRSTFYISGESIDIPANVDVNRKIEFRQLILQVKPVQTAAILYVNYS